MKRFALLLVLAACGDDTSDPTTTPTPQQDAGTPPPPAAVTKSFTIAVTEAAATGVVGPAVPHAKIVFDKPGGERVVVEADDQGIATVTGIDWSLGHATFTAISSVTGLGADTFLDFDEAEAAEENARRPVPAGATRRDYTSYMPHLAGTTVPLHGTIMGAVGNKGTITTLGRDGFAGSWQDDVTGPFHLTVKPATATTLVVLDWTAPATDTVSKRGTEQTMNGWYFVDQAAITADTTHDIDLSTLTKATVQKVNGRMELPADATAWFGDASSAYIGVTTNESEGAAFVGCVSKIDIDSQNKGFDYAMEWATPPSGTLYTTYVILPGQDFSTGASTVNVQGPPTDGLVVKGFIRRTLLGDASTKSLTKANDITESDPDARLVLSVISGGGSNVTWNIVVPKNHKSITLPRIDDTMSAVIGKPTGFTINASKEFDLATQTYKYTSTSPFYKVK